MSARLDPQHGLTVLECAAALTLAALVLATGTHLSHASAMLVRSARLHSEAVDLVRNLIEHEIGAPCAAPLECPDEYRCSVVRAPIVASADRVIARVERVDGAAAEEMSTIAPVPACGG